jgi:hypothetical protein
MMDVETRTMAVLSTAHLSAETRKWLSRQGLLSAGLGLDVHGSWPSLLMGAIPYGWVVWASDRAIDAAAERDPDTPADLWAAMVFCRAAGCDYLLFDADGPEYPGLETYPEGN